MQLFDRSRRAHRGGPVKIGLLMGAALLTIAAASISPVMAQTRRPQAQQAQPASPQPAQIDRNGVLILIRSTLLALHHANQTGNYTVLRDLGAPGFQNANTAARLGEIFATHRAQKLDLSGASVLEPQLTAMPEIVQNGYMRMAGFFPSVPLQVNFEMLFAPVDGSWRLFGLSVNLGPSGPQAPQPTPQQAPQSESKAPEPPKANARSTPKPPPRPSR